MMKHILALGVAFAIVTPAAPAWAGSKPGNRLAQQFPSSAEHDSTLAVRNILLAHCSSNAALNMITVQFANHLKIILPAQH